MERGDLHWIMRSILLYQPWSVGCTWLRRHPKMTVEMDPPLSNLQWLPSSGKQPSVRNKLCYRLVLFEPHVPAGPYGKAPFLVMGSETEPLGL